ncbi:MAG: carboxypeptidase-like regulatory domain-containing protein [Treponema sp.]|jgi:hypothetical protein|nr:carboxypeptidase-like regulatory domain-containing protein [Treponema sp.]
MKKLSEKSRRILRAVYCGLGAATVSLLFQACYGMPMDDEETDVTIYGTVHSPANRPIPGIKVSAKELPSYDYTNSEGYFYIYGSRQVLYEIKFEDVDGAENGSFKTLEKKITHNDTYAHLNIKLEEADEE